MKTRSLMVALVAFSLVACGDDDGVVDGADMGMIGSDGGGGADTSAANPDSGMVNPDSGMVDPDAGVIPDSGMVATDAGMMETDLGVAVDTGPPSMCMVDGNYTLTPAADNPAGCPMGATTCTATLTGSAVALECEGLSADCTIDGDCVCAGTAMLTMPFPITAEFTVDFTNNTATAVALGLTCNYTL